MTLLIWIIIIIIPVIIGQETDARSPFNYSTAVFHENEKIVEFKKIQPGTLLRIQNASDEIRKDVLELEISQSLVKSLSKNLKVLFPNMRKISIRTTEVPANMNSGFFETQFEKILSFELDGFMIEKKVKSFQERTFEKFPSLTEIRINHQHILNFNGRTFRANKFLKKIDLRFNRLINLDRAIFNELYDLVEVDLGANELTSKLELDLFKHNKKLKKLSLYNNKIENFTTAIFSNLGQLEEIDLGQNHIEFLERQLFIGNRRLKSIKLEYNHIKSLPIGILSGLYEIEFVSFSWNRLESVHETLFKETPLLRKIYLVGNRLTEIPEGLFGEAFDLEVLNCNDNEITMLPGNLFRNSRKLKHIKFKSNEISVIKRPFFDGLKDLVEVDLRANECVNSHFSVWNTDSNIENISDVYEVCRENRILPTTDILINEDFMTTAVRSQQLTEVSPEMPFGRPRGLNSYMKKPKTH